MPLPAFIVVETYRELDVFQNFERLDLHPLSFDASWKPRLANGIGSVWEQSRPSYRTNKEIRDDMDRLGTSHDSDRWKGLPVVRIR
jgi:hypothetical protein